MVETAILDRLGSEKIDKLLWNYSIPAIIGSLVVAFYNLIDSFYIGNGPGLGDHAIGGLGIVLPIMTLIAAIGMLVGSGSASRISLYLGMKNIEAAQRILGNAFLLSILLTTSFLLIIYIFLTPILSLIGVTDETYPYAHDFLLFYLPSNIFLTLSFTLNSIMRASGYPKKAMYTMLLGVVLNILLAPVFIFILELGMKGAAIATSISVTIALLPMMHHFLNKKSSLQLQWNKIGLNPKTVWDIMSIGMASFIIQLAASVVVFFINNRLRIYGGSIAIEAYTIANRLNMVLILVILGLTQGMQPIVGYNFGAKKIKRVVSTVNYAAKAGMAVGVIGLIIGLFFSNLAVLPFNPSPDLAKESARALQIITIMLPLSGLQMVISTFFQSIGMPVKATILSLTRQFIFLIPALYILSYFFKLTGVWISIPIADFISTILAGIMYLWQINKFKKIET